MRLTQIGDNSTFLLSTFSNTSLIKYTPQARTGKADKVRDILYTDYITPVT